MENGPACPEELRQEQYKLLAQCDVLMEKVKPCSDLFRDARAAGIVKPDESHLDSLAQRGRKPP